MKRAKQAMWIGAIAAALAVSVTSVQPSSAADPASAGAVQPESAEVQPAPLRNDEPTQTRINRLIETAMYYYWHGGDIQKAEKEIFKGITLRGKYDVVEQAFREAVLLDPYNKNLKFCLASAQLVQKKYDDALRTYQQILNLDPNDYNALLLYGITAKVNGDEQTYQRTMTKLRQLAPAKTEEYLEKIAAAESIMKTKLNTDVPADVQKGWHAIVILGYALADDGTMLPTLIERLKTGLAVAKADPQAKIIVTGGVPKQGVTEAAAMTNWLVSQGIDRSRIIPEDRSTDTVENALFTAAILQQEGITDVTIVTSASHMRRALTVFQEASRLYDRLNGSADHQHFNHVAYLDYPSLAEAQQVTKEEKAAIFRDLLRVSGIWSYPGIQR